MHDWNPVGHNINSDQHVDNENLTDFLKTFGKMEWYKCVASGDVSCAYL